MKLYETRIDNNLPKTTNQKRMHAPSMKIMLNAKLVLVVKNHQLIHNLKILDHIYVI